MCFVINQWKQDYLEQELHLQGTHGQGRAEEEGGLKFTFFPRGGGEYPLGPGNQIFTDPGKERGGGVPIARSP